MVAERSLVDNLKEKFVEDEMSVKREVPLLSKWIDIIGYDEKTDIVIAVEVKVRDWKRAFRQAMRYKLCSDETYVALYDEYIENVDIDKFKKHGIGVISIKEDREIEFVLEPAKNEDYHQSLKRKVIDYLRDHGEGRVEDG